jgi:selenocysteine lyase/cysteine desulfurase
MNMPLSEFKAKLAQAGILSNLRDGLIGEGVMIPGLDGDVPLVYADYVASGRALRQVEEFVAEKVLPFYANSHTEASYCGSYMTGLRRAARAEIARLTGAGDDCSVIFTGSGATAGLNRMVTLFGVDKAQSPVVFTGPYEHHSNILPWRESRAKVVEIPEAETGGPDLDALKIALMEHASSDLKIGSFSAASNVTGILTECDAVSRILKENGALSVWDFAGGGPYLPIDMASEGSAQKDAIVVSPHKFPGGPGASGILILRNSSVRSTQPSWPGGGTVSFVSPWAHIYSKDIATREEAGTPNVIGDIRAALVFLVKEAVGHSRIVEREARFNRLALEAWAQNPRLQLLGTDKMSRLPIFSFLVCGASGEMVHQQLFTRMLSDIYGIQARGGCACAGPYAHHLLGIEQAESELLWAELQAGHEMEKPGWVRLNFSYLMSEDTVNYIIESVNALTCIAEDIAPRYQVDESTARFKSDKRVA